MAKQLEPSKIEPSKLARTKFSGLLLIAFIISLYFLQNKAITPFVESMAKSELFMETPDPSVQQDHTKVALSHCQSFVRNKLDDNASLQFEVGQAQSWELSPGRYLVRSSVTAPDDSGKPAQKKFACNMQFNGGDDAVLENWTLEGLDMGEG